MLRTSLGLLHVYKHMDKTFSWIRFVGQVSNLKYVNTVWLYVVVPTKSGISVVEIFAHSSSVSMIMRISFQELCEISPLHTASMPYILLHWAYSTLYGSGPMLLFSKLSSFFYFCFFRSRGYFIRNIAVTFTCFCYCWLFWSYVSRFLIVVFSVFDFEFGWFWHAVLRFGTCSVRSCSALWVRQDWCTIEDNSKPWQAYLLANTADLSQIFCPCLGVASMLWMK